MDVKPISQEKLKLERAFISQALPFLNLGNANHASRFEILTNLLLVVLLSVSPRTSEACLAHLHYKWIIAADIGFHF
ncbi:hypothetical protein QTO34_005404 [Cnephaeus nilssonii]|uniref:Uncharacterized protein n=1 Tax=Cnephaeus nilssonii TaxID=3371016 RepID=A0AA40HP52_CNENI|nr:hypothetical protein QTO34_005404 [Eptesicus nilssonii]